MSIWDGTIGALIGTVGAASVAIGVMKYSQIHERDRQRANTRRDIARGFRDLLDKLAERARNAMTATTHDASTNTANRCAEVAHTAENYAALLRAGDELKVLLGDIAERLKQQAGVFEGNANAMKFRDASQALLILSDGWSESLAPFLTDE